MESCGDGRSPNFEGITSRIVIIEGASGNDIAEPVNEGKEALGSSSVDDSSSSSSASLTWIVSLAITLLAFAI